MVHSRFVRDVQQHRLGGLHLLILSVLFELVSGLRFEHGTLEARHRVDFNLLAQGGNLPRYLLFALFPLVTNQLFITHLRIALHLFESAAAFLFLLSFFLFIFLSLKRCFLSCHLFLPLVFVFSRIFDRFPVVAQFGLFLSQLKRLFPRLLLEFELLCDDLFSLDNPVEFHLIDGLIIHCFEVVIEKFSQVIVVRVCFEVQTADVFEILQEAVWQSLANLLELHVLFKLTNLFDSVLVIIRLPPW